MGTRIFRDATVTVKPLPSQPEPAVSRPKGPVDFPLLMVVIVFVVFGLLILFSASWDYSLIWYDNPMYQFTRQVIWMFLGLTLAVTVSFLDYHRWKKYALTAMALTIAALILVLLLNEVKFGAVRTMIGGSLQPSELAKVATIVYLSVWMDSKREQLHDVQWGLFPLGFILGIISGLILIQPDLSTAVTVVMLGGLLFFLGGGDMKQIIIMLVLAIVGILIVVKVSSTGQARMVPYLMGLKDLTKASDHVRFSLEAIVNGGLFGVGIGRASTKLVGLPFAPTDSIFAVIAEELGLAGAAGTVILYGLFIWRGLRIAHRAPDMLGSLLASGLTLWIGIEALINMLVMVGLLPFAGNALPFISYGGSNLLSSFLAIGILMSVSRHIAPASETEEWRNLGASVDLRGRNRRRNLSRISRP